MKNFASYIILAPLAAGLTLPASAQTIPPGQTCGGLLCDMGLLGHRSPIGTDGQPVHETPAQVAAAEAADPHHLACHDFLCHAFGQPIANAEAPPAPEPVVAAPAVSATPVRKARRRHIAKAEAAAAAASDTK